jgi:hypothetical protein
VLLITVLRRTDGSRRSWPPARGGARRPTRHPAACTPAAHRGRRRHQRARHGGGEIAELLLPRHEVGLAVDLDHAAAAIRWRVRCDHAFGCHARRFLVSLRQALLAHQLGGGIQIATGFNQAFLHSIMPAPVRRAAA